MSWEWKRLKVGQEKKYKNSYWWRRRDNEYTAFLFVSIGPYEFKEKLRKFPGLETSFDDLKKDEPDKRLLDLIKILKPEAIGYSVQKSPHPNIMEKEINGKKYIIRFGNPHSSIVSFSTEEYLKKKKDLVFINYEGDFLKESSNEPLGISVITSKEGFELADYLLLNFFGIEKPLTIGERIKKFFLKR